VTAGANFPMPTWLGPRGRRAAAGSSAARRGAAARQRRPTATLTPSDTARISTLLPPSGTANGTGLAMV